VQDKFRIRGRYTWNCERERGRSGRIIMCLLLVARNTHPTYPLILLANRDEYYNRRSTSAAFWDEAPFLLAGRDLRAGGTWLGITKSGRIGAVTNYRDPASFNKDAPSRGKLVSDFLMGQESPVMFLNRVDRDADRFNGFNLIIGDKERLFWYSNRSRRIHPLPSGIHGLSNHLLNTPWPKVTKAQKALSDLLSEHGEVPVGGLFRLLADRSIAPDEALPKTGVGLEWERILSPIFIVSPTYGTRSSTVLLIDRDDQVTFVEKTFNSDLNHAHVVRHEFTIET